MASSSSSAAAPSSSSGTTRSNTGAEVVWLGDEHLGTYLLRNKKGFTAKISLYGAQVISWKNAQGKEMLFLSSKAIFQEGELIRGGIPICFPESFDRHEMVRPDERAFASKSFWSVDADSIPFPTSANNDEPFIDLILKSSPKFYFRHNVEMRLKVLLNTAGQLIMTTRVRNTNTDGRRFDFIFAYHNYLSVSDIGEIRVEDIETLYYRDYLEDKQLFTAPADASTFESEVDRLYVTTNHWVTVFDHSVMRKIIIRTDAGLPDVVVWNPWDEKAKTITNFDKDEYKKMLCIGPARMEKPIVLKPGEEWKGMQTLIPDLAPSP